MTTLELVPEHQPVAKLVDDDGLRAVYLVGEDAARAVGKAVARADGPCQSVVTSLIDSFDDYLELLVTTIKDLIRQTASKGTPAGIGIGAPNANRLDGTIRYAPNLRWARDSDGKPGVIHLAQRLEAATAPKSLQMVTAVIILKDACSLE